MQDPTHQPSDLNSSSNDLKDARSAVQNVIEYLVDSREALQQISERLDDQDVKRFLLAELLRRAEFRGDLESVLHQAGVHDIHESGTVAGKVHRLWARLKSSLGGGDHTLLLSAEAIENSVYEAYQNALDSNLPLNVRQVLRSQMAHIKLSHEYVCAARDHTEAA